MAQPANCEECRAIERELGYVWMMIGAPENPNEMAKALELRRSQLAHLSETETDGRPAVPAELLDLNKSHQQFFSRVSQGHFTRAFYRKLRHEGQTGHKIKFPPAR
jgi:hypothetical protein